MPPNSDHSLTSTAQIQVPGLGVITVHSDDRGGIWDVSDAAAIKVICETFALEAIAAVKKERETAGSNQGDGDGGEQG